MYANSAEQDGRASPPLRKAFSKEPTSNILRAARLGYCRRMRGATSRHTNGAPT